MSKKLKLKSGLCHQLYATVFISIGIILVYIFFFILGLFLGKPALESLIGLFPFAYLLIAVWLIFFLIRLILGTIVEVDGKGFVKKRRNKVVWTIDWIEIEKIEYFKMPWHFFLSPNIYKGELVITYIKKESITKEQIVNFFQKDVKKIINKFNKDIIVY